MNNLFNLKDRIIIVTGGNGFLGKHYCEYLLAQGSKVICWDLPHTGVPGLPSDNYWIFGIDICQQYQVIDALRLIKNQWGVPDGLINNAGLDFPPESENEEWLRIDEALEVNVNGTLNCCDAVGSEMAEARRGSIINIGSIYGMLSPDQRIYSDGFKKPIGYSVSKSALYGMTRYLSTYWAERKVRVNLLTLGGVFNAQPYTFIKNYVDRVPMGRMAKPDDYCGAIHYLLSDASIYMTGSNIVLDGGYSVW